MLLRSLLAAFSALAALAAFAPAPPQDTGSIEGRILAAPHPARRVAARYPGGGGGMHSMGAVPAVAFLNGRVGGPARSDEDARLVQRDTSFRPALLIVPVGARVNFTNQDPVFHNVFSYSSPKRFDLGRFPRGESRTVTFDRPGIVKVYCEVHQWMRSAVIVVENPYHAAIGEDGRFRLSGVPAGRHRLTVWDADRGERTVDVTVQAGAAARVEIRL